MDQLEIIRINAKIMKTSKTSFDIFALFYIFIYLLIFISIAYFSNNYWNSHSIYHHFTLVTTSISAFILFFIVKNNPGFIHKEQPENQENFNQGISNDFKDPDKSLIGIEMDKVTFEGKNIKNVLHFCKIDN
jgi:hypothetical protein